MKKKIPFDLQSKQDIIDGKISVVTRNDKPVEILCWEKKGTRPIVGVIDLGSKEIVKSYIKSGRFYETDGESSLDLFLLIDEPLSEFEQAIERLTNFSYCAVYEEIKQIAKELLDLARKELLPEYEKQLIEVCHSQDEVQYHNGYEKGKREVLDSLPKWKFWHSYANISSPSTFTEEGHDKISRLYYKGYYIDIKELFDKLPKED